MRRGFRYFIAAVALVVAAAMAWHHYQQLAEGGASNQELIFAAAYLWLVLLTVAPYFHRDSFPTSEAGRAMVKRLRVNVTIPAHNEDPLFFRNALESVSMQTRLPDRVHVVENGYAQPKLRAVFEAWRRESCPRGVEARYDLIPEPSKRVAQVHAWDQDPRADILFTMDSDVILDPGAIENGVAPFWRRAVQSVAGLVVGANHRKRFLARLIEASYVCSYIGGRAGKSMLNTVDVNCGTLAFYRASIMHKYRDHYLNHTVAGRKFTYGDDAMMTRYALMEGQTLFQASAWGYTLHPINIKHLTKQRLRWWRSFFWGGMWLLLAFSPRRMIWWLTAWKFTGFIWYTFIFATVILEPAVAGQLPIDFFVWAIMVGVLTQARYLSIRRPDETFAGQFVTFLLSPLAGVLNIYLCWVLQYIGLATCLKTGWSTRKQIEVGLGGTVAAHDITAVIPAVRGDVTMRLPRLSDDTIVLAAVAGDVTTRLPRLSDDTIVFVAVEKEQLV